MNDKPNLPKILYGITGTYEYELLIELMLRYWEHPLADDDEFRNALAEEAAEFLKRAADGIKVQELPANEVNLVFAIWNAETSLVDSENSSATTAKRQLWLDTIKKSLPSCFCSQDLLN